MSERATLKLKRDCEAIAIPSGRIVRLEAGCEVSIMQALGGHYTVTVGGNLARIDGMDADALGLIGQVVALEPVAGEDLEAAVKRVLGTVYDPEIPVDILALGLVYRCAILPLGDNGSRVEIDMTLTAPGCGMGAVLVAEVRQRLLRLPGVREVEVRLVFDPPWDRNRMSEAARLKLGLL